LALPDCGIGLNKGIWGVFWKEDRYYVERERDSMQKEKREIEINKYIYRENGEHMKNE